MNVPNGGQVSPGYNHYFPQIILKSILKYSKLSYTACGRRPGCVISTKCYCARKYVLVVVGVVSSIRSSGTTHIAVGAGVFVQDIGCVVLSTKFSVV